MVYGNTFGWFAKYFRVHNAAAGHADVHPNKHIIIIIIIIISNGERYYSANIGRVVSTFNGSEQRRRKWGQREVAVGPDTYGAQQGVTASGDLLLVRTPEGDSAGTVDVVRLCMPARLAGELPK